MTILFQNSKHHYIPPTVSFEEMEEESFVMTSVGATGAHGGSGDASGGGNVIIQGAAKSSTFIWDEDIFKIEEEEQEQ